MASLRAVKLKDGEQPKINDTQGATEQQTLSPRLIELMKKGNNIFDDFVKNVVDDFQNNPMFRMKLGEEFKKVGFQIVATPIYTAPALPLPEKAPRLWADERNLNPAAFIRDAYANWLDQGLTRADIKKLDPPLYVAYAQWIRPGRHPEDAITFAASHMFNAYADPVEATNERRRLSREARARQRAKARDDKLSQNVLSKDNM